MKGIVHKLQEEALDKSVRVSDLLRKALLVARKLKVPDIETWIRNELDGYPDTTKVPSYRIIYGEMKSKNPYTGAWLPIVFHNFDDELRDAMNKRPCGQPLSEIEAILTKDRDGVLAMNYPPKVQEQIMKGTKMELPPVLLVQEARLHGIADTVRTAILDWALKLEEQGVLGEDLSFSENDQRAASHITFNIGTMSHSQIQADTSSSQQVLIHGSIDPEQLLKFVAKVRSALDSLALQVPDTLELKGELDTLEAQAKSPKPKPQILRESGRTVRTILEGATGNAVAEGLLAALRALFGG